MKTITGKYLSSILMGLAALLLATACYSQEEFLEAELSGGPEYKPNFMEPDELLQLIKDKSEAIVIVDTAPAMQWEEEHIVGAISFPWVANVTPPIALPRNKTLVLYCPCTGDDADAIDMAKKLRMFGYFNTKILRGGWFEWEELGYPIESIDSEEDA
ncbi:MAG TPA: rhodanese-like domain-containing protein [Gammaproteobacteria bacterium]|nr:rhodanese-like domain-containing protein [Gammaproteobacteria bacterium]